VLLGVSGAGKSTCVQMMLGYSMTLSKNSRGLTTLIPVGGLK
jgi:ABC-type multidrug transport system ATPase subunit